jgi:hypothetical protein
MNLYQKWIQHLQENNMTYIEHLIFAIYYGLYCLFFGTLLILHGVFPCFFSTTGRYLVTKLSARFDHDPQI